MPLRRSFSFYILASILAYLPFRTLFYQNAHYNGLKIAPLFQFFPEAVLLVGLLVAVVSLVPRIPKLKKAPLLIILSMALVAYALVTVVYSHNSLVWRVSGIWFDFEGLLALMFIWVSPPTREEKRILFKIAIGGLLFIAIFGILEALIVPGFAVWLGHMGYSPDQHYVGKIRQIRSLLPGPNPLSTMMLVLAGLLISFKNRVQADWLFAVIGGIIGLTYSRSSWLGIVILGAATFFFFLWSKQKQLLRKPVLLAVGMMLGVLIGAYRYGETWKAIVTHNISTENHVQKSTKAVEESVSGPGVLLFGHGIGTAGPASEHTDNAQIAESWYLQLVQELGLLGLGLYLWLMVELLLILKRRAEFILVFLTVGLMANALFLHIWADNHYLNMLFWIIVGLVLLAGQPAFASEFSSPR